MLKNLTKIIFLVSLHLFTLTTNAEIESDLPDLGLQADASLTAAEEYRTGAAVIRNLQNAGLIVNDPLVTDYLNQLGYNLLSHHNQKNTQSFQFFLMNDNSLNAFALPGGFILVNYGLFQRTDSEGELASVLAHEIAHVTQRHYARAYGISNESNLPIIAAIIAAIILGSQGSGDVGQAALATATAAQAQKQINFTRHNEEEADRIGIQILASTGFHPENMASFFDKIDRESRLHGINVPEFLRTHPVSASRISDAKDRARLLPKSKKTPDPQSYLIMRHRIQSLASRDKHNNIKTYIAELENNKGPELIATRYGYVLALIRVEQYKEALRQIELLLQVQPMRIAFLLAKAEILSHAKQTAQAIETYKYALSIYPGNASILHDYVHVLLQNKNYTQALKELKDFLKTPAYNPIFYKYLAEAHANLGNLTDSHEMQAEYHYQRGQLHQALDQLDIALKTTQDFYKTSRIEAKQKLIREEIPLNKN